MRDVGSLTCPDVHGCDHIFPKKTFGCDNSRPGVLDRRGRTPTPFLLLRAALPGKKKRVGLARKRVNRKLTTFSEHNITEVGSVLETSLV